MRYAFLEYASSGTSGCYVDEYFKALGRDRVQYFTSYYHSANYSNKIFYRFTDLAGPYVRLNSLKNVRIVLRIIEFAYAHIFIIFMYLRKIDVVVYALSSNSILDECILLVYQKVFKRQVYIIAHDVIPFGSNSKYYNSRLKQRFRIFSRADKIIVHGLHSISHLREHFIAEEKIFRIPFPIFELSHFHAGSRFDFGKPIRYILFIGHVREEKGVDLLIEACQRIDNTEFNLVVAGLFPKSLAQHLFFGKIFDERFYFINRYLKDHEMISLISHSDFVVLPYRFGTNSGILSMCLALEKIILASDIEMFLDYQDLPLISFFKRNDVNSLVNVLEKLFDNQDNELPSIDLHSYRTKFYSEVKELFK